MKDIFGLVTFTALALRPFNFSFPYSFSYTYFEEEASGKDLAMHRKTKLMIFVRGLDRHGNQSKKSRMNAYRFTITQLRV